MTRTLSIVAALITVTGALLGCSGKSSEGGTVLRVGYQKWGTVSILKASGQLETALVAKGWRVEWVEFPAGPPLLEAMNAGSIDIGHAGDSPPLFAQAAGVPFVYIAASSPSPESSAVLVRSDSSVQSVSDLQGKKVGFTKGSSAHTMVVRVLEKNGLPVDSVQAVYLSPADGRVALAAGSIDAWSVWDPYLSAAEHAGAVRRLVDGRGVVTGREFYLAAKDFVARQPGVTRLFLSELGHVKEWAKARPDEVNRMLAEQTGLDIGAIQKAESRRNRYDTRPLTEELIEEQQALADRYLHLGLLPGKIDIRSAVHREE